jgi:acylphosphatase
LTVVARRVVVHGRVQGVFFRETVRRRAYRAGVAGWVRNNDDGSVEAWLEGDPDDVEVMVRFAGIGPSGAYVESVDVEDVEPAELRGFEVR